MERHACDDSDARSSFLCLQTRYRPERHRSNHLHGAYACRVYTNALPKQRPLDLKLGSNETGCQTATVGQVRSGDFRSFVFQESCMELRGSLFPQRTLENPRSGSIKCISPLHKINKITESRSCFRATWHLLT